MAIPADTRKGQPHRRLALVTSIRLPEPLGVAQAIQWRQRSGEVVVTHGSTGEVMDDHRPAREGEILAREPAWIRLPCQRSTLGRRTARLLPFRKSLAALMIDTGYLSFAA